MVKYIEIDGIGEVVPRSEYDALAAHVEVLQRHIANVNQSYKDRQHHLRELLAEAVLDFHHAWSQQTRVNSLAQFANQYADSILKGGAE